MKSKKTGKYLPLVMWQKFDIDFFDFKGVIYPFSSDAKPKLKIPMGTAVFAQNFSG